MSLPGSGPWCMIRARTPQTSRNAGCYDGGAEPVVRLEAPTGQRRAHLLALALDTGAHAHRALFVHLALRVHDYTAVGVDEPCVAVAHRRAVGEDVLAENGREDHECRWIGVRGAG